MLSAMLSEQLHPEGCANFTPDQWRVLGDAYQRLVDQDRWPSFVELDYDADQHGVEDPLAVMRSLTPTHLQGLGETGTPSLTQELSLSLTGVAATAASSDMARQDLELFAKSVRAAVAISDAATPPNVARFDALGAVARLLTVPQIFRLWSDSA